MDSRWRGGNRQSPDLHGNKTQPLHPYLEYPEKPSETGHPTDLRATGDILRGLWENKDIRKGRGGRGGAQEDKVGRDTE